MSNGDTTDIGTYKCAESECDYSRSALEPGSGAANSSKTGLIIVSLGDEIAMVGPVTQDGYISYLRTADVALSTVGCTNWSNCPMLTAVPGGGGSLTPPPDMNATESMRWYTTQRYAHNVGISTFRNRTITQKSNHSNVTVGANFSPLKNDWGSSSFIGSAFQWVRSFREGALLLPWSEDWVFTTPVASQQVVTLLLDAMRSGIQWTDTDQLPVHFANGTTGGYQRVPTPKRHLNMLMYVMHHFPGQTNANWKRQLFGDLAHGVTMFDFFFFEPSLEGSAKQPFLPHASSAFKDDKCLAYAAEL
jgi:hypothetical protein